MSRDLRRYTPPSGCVSPSCYETLRPEALVDSNGCRLDGRRVGDMKPICLKAGLIHGVTGSAYLELGNTKVIASVNGPRDVLQKDDSSSKGSMYCLFKYATFSCKEVQTYIPTEKEWVISRSIIKALEPVILLEKFPNARLDLHIVILEDDGCALTAGIICAGVALANAGIEMYDLPVGCTIVSTDGHLLIDPTAKEEAYTEGEYYSKMVLCMMPEFNKQVIFMENIGCFKALFYNKATKILQNNIKRLSAYLRNHLKEHIENLVHIGDAKDDDNDEASASGESHSEGESASIQAAQLKLFQPHTYMKAHLDNNIRPDGRELKEFRSVLMNVGVIGTAYGSALVRFGDTSVLCGVKASLAKPTEEKPNMGFFVPNVTLTPVCSNKFQPGVPGVLPQVYSSKIMNLVKSSGIIDFSSLCICENYLVWCLRIEILGLSHDGNIFDACVLALMAALKNTKLPVVNTENMEEEEDAFIEVTNKLVPLELKGFVFSASFVNLEDYIVADPSQEEEDLAAGTLNVFVKEDYSVLIESEGVVEGDDICSSITCAKNRYTELKKLIDESN